MGIEFDSETRIVIGRLSAPSDPAWPWWWQSSTKVDGVDITMAGFARTESDAILEAAARTIDLRLTDPPRPKPPPSIRTHEPGWWPGLNDPP